MNNHSLATLGAAASLLAVAGPAGADGNVTSGAGQTLQRHVTDGTPFPADGLKYDTEVVDYWVGAIGAS